MAQPEQYIIHFTDPSKSSFIVSPYTTNGRKFPTSTALDSQAISAASSLLLYGKGSANYGERIQENILHMLEHFSGSTVPTLPISGQAWFSRREYWRLNDTTWYRWNDSTSLWESLTVTTEPNPGPAGFDGQYWYSTTDSTLNRRTVDTNHPLNNTWITVIHHDGAGLAPTVNDTPEKAFEIYDGEQWVSISSSTFASATAPFAPEEGDLWYDTTGIKQLKVYNGSTWVSSGGNYVLTTGDIMTGDLTMTAANINIDEGQGLVGNVAGSPLGDGATLLLSSGGLDWETVGGITIKNSASASVLTIGVGGATLSTFAGNVAMSGNEVLGLPATPSATGAASKEYVDAQIGGVPSALDDITDVDVPSPAHDEFLYFDNTGSPTGFWRSKPAAPLNSPAFTGLPTAPTATPATSNTLQLATTAFVQDAIVAAAAAGADGVLDSATFNSTSMVLTLTTAAPASGLFSPDLTHTHTSPEVTHSFTDSLLRDAFVTGGSPEVTSNTLDNVVEQLSLDIHRKTSRQLNEQLILRQIFRPTASQTEFLLDNDEEFLGGYNRLQVTVNGIKQYGDEQARQAMYFRRDFNVSPTAPTGLPNDGTAYSFTVAVDGQATGSPQTPQTVSITGSQVQTLQDIIDQINIQVTGATAIFDPRWVGIFVFSDTAGNGSAIDIVDVDLFSSLAAIGATVSLPIYDTGNINPAYPSAITQVTNDGAYYEATVPAGSPLTYVQATAGSAAIAVVFNTAVPSGAVVEFLIT